VIEVPGEKPLILSWAVFDLNGTLAIGGELVPGTVPRMQALSARLSCLLLSSDTYGTLDQMGRTLGIPVRSVRHGEEKAAVVRELEGGVVAVGNGVNDAPMFRAADLALAILGEEGLAAAALTVADLVVPSPLVALELLLNPLRLHATLKP
jgi:P-type E1-E2 ATPase